MRPTCLQDDIAVWPESSASAAICWFFIVGYLVKSVVDAQGLPMIRLDLARAIFRSAAFPELRSRDEVSHEVLLSDRLPVLVEHLARSNPGRRGEPTSCASTQPRTPTEADNAQFDLR